MMVRMNFNTQAEAAAYLSALVDGEGHVDAETFKQPIRRIRISNTDLDILQAGYHACEVLGIEARIHPQKVQGPRRKPAWVLVIRKTAAIQRAASVLTLASASKASRLVAAAEWASKRPGHKRNERTGQWTATG